MSLQLVLYSRNAERCLVAINLDGDGAVQAACVPLPNLAIVFPTIPPQVNPSNGWIAGVVIGVLVLIVVLVLAAALLLRRRKARSQNLVRLADRLQTEETVSTEEKQIVPTEEKKPFKSVIPPRSSMDKRETSDIEMEDLDDMRYSDFL